MVPTAILPSAECWSQLLMRQDGSQKDSILLNKYDTFGILKKYIKRKVKNS